MAAPAGERRDEAKQRRNAMMICVTVETREGALTPRARITAPSIKHALRIARGGKPNRKTRLVFPIDPEVFFVPEDSGQSEVP